MTAHRVHFTISGQFITEQARNFWLEDPAYALDFLGAAGVEDEATQLQIVLGKMALEGNNEYHLVEDDTTEINGEPLPRLVDVLFKAKKDKEWLQSLTKAVGEYLSRETEFVGTINGGLRVPRSWTTKHPSGNYSVLRLFGVETFEEAKARVLRYFPDAYIRYIDAETDKVNVSRITNGLKPIEVALAEVEDQALEDIYGSKDAAAEASVALNVKDYISYRNGYVLPDGTFHACGYMEHRYILNALEFTVEPVTWVKVTDTRRRYGQGLPVESEYICWPKDITQKQRDVVWDWACAHQLEKVIEFPE